MKSCLNYLLTLSLFFATGSCVIDHDIDNPNPKGGDKNVMLKVSVPHAGFQNPDTRAMGVTEENMIETLDILAFKVDGGSETYQYWAQASKETTHVEGAFYQSFSAMLREQRHQQRFVIITNAHAKVMELLGQADWSNVDKEIMLSRLEIQLGSGNGWNATGPANFTAIPMWGQSEPKVIEGATTTLGTISLLRMVAKIDVQVDVDNHPALASTFKFKSVHVYNTNTSGRIVPKPGTEYVGTDMIAKKASLPAFVHTEAEPLVYTDFSSPGSPNVAMKGAIYLFETAAQNAGNMLEETCIVVGGVYGNDTQISYYRLDFMSVNGSSHLDILRNHKYTFTIVTVKGRGYSTANEAFHAKSFNMEANMLVWDEGEIRNIVFNGQYMLGVSCGRFEFNEEAHDITETDNTLKIATDYPLGWTADVWADQAGTVSAPWLTITPDAGVGGAQSDQMHLLLAANAGSERTAYVHIHAGVLIYKVVVTQDLAGITVVSVDPENVFLDYDSSGDAVVVISTRPSGKPNPNTNWTLSVPLAAQSWLKISFSSSTNFAAASTTVSGTGERTVYLYLSGVYHGNAVRTTLLELDSNPSACMIIQTPNPDYIDYDGTPPAGVITYVGAFWKTSQTGERIIRIAGMYDAHVGNRGPWHVAVSWYDDRWDDHNGDGIVFSTSKLSVSKLEARGISFTSNMTPEDAESVNSRVTDGTTAVSGVVNTANKDIVFRIGLQKAFGKYSNNPDYQTTFPARYAVVQIVYGNNPVKIQRFFIRQGEGDDRIFGPTRISPYNLGISSNRNYYGNGGFVTYPTQAGYFYQWGYSTTSSVPTPYHPTYPVTGLPQGWTQTGYNYALVDACPPNYHIPTRNEMDALFEQNSHSFWGYYADGFFDRRQIQNSVTASHESPERGVNSAVSNSNDYVAYIGNLFFNPATNSTLFFPASGYRNGALRRAGNDGMYASSTNTSGITSQNVFLNFWPSTHLQSGANIANYDKVTGYSIRCTR
ncbi:MAG: hypothetical protein FWE99_01585 [Bacteroidales bacterium]|nr:hypothetical protein [Bacteroidales bacterium]